MAIFPKIMGSDGRPTSLKTSHTRLTAYNGSAIEHFGTMQLRCRYADSTWKEATFFVADTSGPVIFGLNVSQDLIQRTMDVVLEDLLGVVSIADDIVCTGKDDKEHDHNLHLLMAHAQERGLVFNLDKCAVKTPEINFFGNQYTKDGVQPDPDKVQAIADINLPSDAKELQQYLGLVTYLSAYIPQLSDHTSILRDLLKKDSEFQWHPEHQDAFDALKKLICHSTKLCYFDPNKDTIIQVDASSVALGTALTQEGKVVAYAAKSLTDTERCYANIEHELLACVFSAERFHTYVFGKPFVIESDHKPLEMIQGKPLAAAYNGSAIEHFGTMQLRCRYADSTWKEATFFVADTSGPVIFGLNVSQDLIQRTMDVVLEDLLGVVSIADDIVCTGKDDKEHDHNLHLLMAHAQERGLVFNLDKCAVKTPEINFFGNQYTKDGVQPDPDKVQAIADINLPSDAKELQQYLGLVTYLSAYIPQLSDHTSILRDLLKKDSEFQWHPEHQDAFDALKKLICHSTKLCYFDPNKDTIIQVDASSVALGTALTQEGKVVAYAAKSLTDTERCYANIEHELLACVFSAERFHTYVFGKPFVIESDHKPLEMIQGKPLAAAPARLQRMLLRLQGYDCTIKYRPVQRWHLLTAYPGCLLGTETLKSNWMFKSHWCSLALPDWKSCDEPPGKTQCWAISWST